MGGFFMEKLRSYAAIVSWQEYRSVTLYHQTAVRVICATPHKKGASIALTSLGTLRHNNFVRECVHCERVLAQPMTSE